MVILASKIFTYIDFRTFYQVSSFICRLKK